METKEGKEGVTEAERMAGLSEEENGKTSDKDSEPGGQESQKRKRRSSDSTGQGHNSCEENRELSEKKQKNIESIEMEQENRENESAERGDNCQELTANKEVDTDDVGVSSEAETSNTKKGEGTQELSKRQRKKQLKRQRWLDTKVERRQREREKLRQRMKAKQVAGEPRGNIRKQLKRTTMASSVCQQKVVIDMSFDDLMIEKHLCQCVKQVSRCYSANRRTRDPAQLYVTSFTGKCASIMARQNGYQNWDVNFKPEHFAEIFPTKDQIVYLSSESENVVTSLDESTVYVIGGLVDHNVHKGLCLRLAKERGLRHARLPIDEFVKMKTRKVLTIDQVFRIVLGVANGRLWRDAFLDAIPARKGAVGKEEEGEEGSGVERKRCEGETEADDKASSIIGKDRREIEVVTEEMEIGAFIGNGEEEKMSDRDKSNQNDEKTEENRAR